jgi:hypothetical protein
MNPIPYRDRENRFEDVCKFAAALVAVGLIVFAGESAMQRIPEVTAVEAARAAPVAPPFDYFPDQFTIDAAARAEPHVEAF